MYYIESQGITYHTKVCRCYLSGQWHNNHSSIQNELYDQEVLKIAMKNTHRKNTDSEYNNTRSNPP